MSLALSRSIAEARTVQSPSVILVQSVGQKGLRPDVRHSTRRNQEVPARSGQSKLIVRRWTIKGDEFVVEQIEIANKAQPSVRDPIAAVGVVK